MVSPRPVDRGPSPDHRSIAVTRAEAFYQGVPYPVGESPFHVKGVAYVYHASYVRDELPGGTSAERAALGSLGDAEFWRTEWKAGVTYDLLPLIAAGHACAEVLGVDTMEFVRMRAEHQAEHDMTSARRFLLSVMTPRMLAKRLPFFSSQFFTFGQPGAEPLPDGARIWLRGVPTLIAPWMAASCEGFMAHSLRATGAKAVHVRRFESAHAGAANGSPLVDVGLDITWAQTG